MLQPASDDHFLEFTHVTMTLQNLGDAVGAYDKLIKALTGKSPTWPDFTAFLEREGYAKKVVR